MSIARLGVRATLAVVVMLAIAAVGAPAAMAETTVTACVPYVKTTGKLATGKPIVAGTETGTCKDSTAIHYHPLNIPEAGGFETLNKLLAHMTFIESGVGGKPTIQFSGVNVQVVSGAGKTNAAVNGEGNLVIGYDENAGKHEQTGSHDLILGEEQTFTSFAGIVAGAGNLITGQYASVTGGQLNTASASFSSVTGGRANTAAGVEASVTGGDDNHANGTRSSVSGGNFNTTTLNFGSVSGGNENTAGFDDSVSGGRGNTASSANTSILGGHNLTTTNEFEVLPSCVAPGKAGELC